MEQSEHKSVAEFTLDIEDVKGSIRAMSYVVSLHNSCAH